jgi:hypothetical protein
MRPKRRYKNFDQNINVKLMISYIIMITTNTCDIYIFFYSALTYNIKMSFLYFGNTPASVPPVLDTTPCMKQMMDYEECVVE